MKFLTVTGQTRDEFSRESPIEIDANQSCFTIDQYMQGVTQTGAKPQSLLDTAVFQSRFEKDLQTAKIIRTQLDAGVTKGTCRLVSTKWMSDYFKWIEFI